MFISCSFSSSRLFLPIHGAYQNSTSHGVSDTRRHCSYRAAHASGPSVGPRPSFCYRHILSLSMGARGYSIFPPPPPPLSPSPLLSLLISPIPQFLLCQVSGIVSSSYINTPSICSFRDAKAVRGCSSAVLLSPVLRRIARVGLIIHRARGEGELE